MYIVYGGVYKDTTFEELDYTTEEEYGPFNTYEEALAVWRGKTGWKVDICTHRLFILDFSKHA